MIRATLNVSKPEQMKEAYQILTKIDAITILKIKNKLSTELQNVTINFIYKDKIIGEIQIRHG